MPTLQPPGLGLGPQLPTPPPLPSPPLLDQVLFESPFLLAGPLAALAVVALFTYNARADLKRGLQTAGVLLALAAIAFSVSTLITTPRETVLARTRALIDAVARADTTALDPMLTDDIEIRYTGFDSPSKPALLIRIAGAMGEGGQYHLASWRISELQSAIDGPAVARAQVLVRATHEATGLPASAWVLLIWRRQPDGTWRCSAVRPIDVR